MDGHGAAIYDSYTQQSNGIFPLAKSTLEGRFLCFDVFPLPICLSVTKQSVPIIFNVYLESNRA